MSPLEIRLLCDVWTGAPIGEYAKPEFITETLESLEMLQLVKAVPRQVPSWAPGSALKTYMEAIQAIPAPELVWTIPDKQGGLERGLQEAVQRAEIRKHFGKEEA